MIDKSRKLDELEEIIGVTASQENANSEVPDLSGKLENDRELRHAFRGVRKARQRGEDPAPEDVEKIKKAANEVKSNEQG